MNFFKKKTPDVGATGAGEHADGPAASPDILAPPPNRGQGVRRPNKLPLLLGMGFAGCAAMVLIYSMNSRAAAQKAAKDNPAAAEASASKAKPTAGKVPDAVAKAQASGVVPISDSLSPDQAKPGQIQLTQADPNAVQNQQSGATMGSAAPPASAPASPVTQVYQSPYEAQWRNYDQAKATIDQARFDRANQAYSADMGVEAKGGRSSAQAPAPNPMADVTAQLMQAANRLGQVGQQTPAQPPATRISAGAETGTKFYSSARLQPAQSQTEIKAGSVIPAVLVSGINSDLPGQLVAQVSRNVFDSTTGRYLLIPQGAKLVGDYESDVAYGQARVQIAWKRLILPDGSSLDLGKAPGADRAGYSGLRDKVNNHYGRAYGAAFMVSLFSAGIQLSQPQASNNQNISAGQTTASAIGQQMGQLGMEQARKNLSIKPELQIRPGYRFNVTVTEDLILREWRAR